MTAKRVIDYTRFNSEMKLEKFLPFHKNFAPNQHGDTLYKNLKYRDDLGLVRSRLFIERPDKYVPEYEYVPYENYYYGTMGLGMAECLDVGGRKEILSLFSLFKQHHLYGVYRLPDQTPIAQAREELLIPLYDKIYGLGSCYAFLSYINRIDSDHISIETFLFGVADLDGLVIQDILSAPGLINCSYDRLAPHNSMY
jgi:hypothetical protein